MAAQPGLGNLGTLDVEGEDFIVHFGKSLDERHARGLGLAHQSAGISLPEGGARDVADPLEATIRTRSTTPRKVVFGADRHLDDHRVRRQTLANLADAAPGSAPTRSTC